MATPAQSAPATPAAPPVIADADEAPDKATAAAIAREYDHPVTDESSLTDTTTVEVLPDGTEELTISTEPVRVRQDDRWVDVSTELTETSDGMLTPAASPVPVEFSSGGAGPLARIQTTTGAWMTIASPLGELPDAVVDDSSVTYPEVLPGVDLRLTATITGLSEVLVIKTPEAAENPRLDEVRFGISGAKVADGAADESATATAADGSTLVSPSPMWWDSADGGDADGPGGAGIAEPVEAENADASITIDASIPADADDVTYPAYVDPDFTGGMQYWTLVDSAYPNASYWNGANRGADNQAHVGNISAALSPDGRAHTDRTFWRFNTSGLGGKHILGATFNTQQLYSSACTSNVYNLWLAGIIDPATTWNRQPAILAPVSRTTLGPQRSNCAQQYGVGLDAMAAANWAAAYNAPDVTVGLTADNESDWTSWRRFTSGASMIVRYNTPPETPWGAWNVDQACSTTAPGPAFRNNVANKINIAVLASDRDTGTNVGVVFWVQDAAGNNVLPAKYTNGWIDSGMKAPGVFDVTIPNDLPDGAYRWVARTYDGIDNSPGWSPWCYFQIRNPAPGAPVVTPSVPATSTLTVGDPVTVTLGQRAPGDGVVGYAYTWGSDEPTYTTLPPCGVDNQAGRIHYVCESTATTITVAPVAWPQAELKVWAFGYNRARSVATTVSWPTVLQSAGNLAASSHQWTTDAGGLVPAADCPSGTVPVACVADNNRTDPDWLNGQYPIAIPPGVTLGGTPGALDFSSTARTPMVSGSGIVVDTTKSFTVGGWMTPTRPASGLYQTAMSARGGTNPGFLLQLDPQLRWSFVVGATTQSNAGRVALSTPVSLGQRVHVAGVYDAVNHELRIYVNGRLQETQGYRQPAGPTASLGVTLGSAFANGVVGDFYGGKIENPFVIQGQLVPFQIEQVSFGEFFPGLD